MLQTINPILVVSNKTLLIYDTWNDTKATVRVNKIKDSLCDDILSLLKCIKVHSHTEQEINDLLLLEVESCLVIRKPDRDNDTLICFRNELEKSY